MILPPPSANVISIGMTKSDPIVGWEAIGTTAHPVSEAHLEAQRIWKQRDCLIEAGLTAGALDMVEIERLGDLAEALERSCNQVSTIPVTVGVGA